ncbi:MAG: hypothetical protein WCJ25_01170 [Candidatus Moraniibacteriota bacterium]
MRKDLFFGMFATVFLSFTAWLFWTSLSPVSFVLITGCSVSVNALLFFCLSWTRSERSPFPVRSIKALVLACTALAIGVFVLSFFFPSNLIDSALMVRYGGISLIVAVAMAMITTERTVAKTGYSSYRVTDTRLLTN